MALMLLASLSVQSQSVVKFKFLLKNKRKPVVCMCRVNTPQGAIDVPTDSNGEVDLTAYCNDSNYKIDYLPANPDFVGKYFHCKNASKTIEVLDKNEYSTLLYNSFALMKEDETSKRYKMIAAAGQTELAHINRRIGDKAAADSLESSAIKLTIEALALDREDVLFEQERAVLNETGESKVAEIQVKLGLNPDSIIGPKTISKAALIETNWLYTNKSWKKNKINEAVIATGEI